MAAARLLIVGLGNPGPAYARNRHNVGFQCLNLLARSWRIAWERSGAHCRLGIGKVAGQEVVVAKPRTYMNESGLAVTALLRRFAAPPSQLLVLCDDMDLAQGRIRIREGGSSGGHRGLQSIIDRLASQDFPRLRVGIGRPEGIDAAFYVLSDFSSEEETVMEGVRRRVAEAVACVVNEGMAAAMNRYN